METVRTSEVLESQILEDARAKAKRILGAADKECEGVRAEWEQRNAEEARRLDGCAGGAGRRHAAGPQGLSSTGLHAVAAGFLPEGGIGRPGEPVRARWTRGSWAGSSARQVAKASFAFANQKLVVWYAGISEQEARRIVAENIPGATVQEVKQLPPESGGGERQGIDRGDRGRRAGGSAQPCRSCPRSSWRSIARSSSRPCSEKKHRK